MHNSHGQSNESNEDETKACLGFLVYLFCGWRDSRQTSGRDRGRVGGGLHEGILSLSVLCLHLSLHEICHLSLHLFLHESSPPIPPSIPPLKSQPPVPPSIPPWKSPPPISPWSPPSIPPWSSPPIPLSILLSIPFFSPPTTSDDQKTIKMFKFKYRIRENGELYILCLFCLV